MATSQSPWRNGDKHCVADRGQAGFATTPFATIAATSNAGTDHTRGCARDTAAVHAKGTGIFTGSLPAAFAEHEELVCRYRQEDGPGYLKPRRPVHLKPQLWFDWSKGSSAPEKEEGFAMAGLHEGLHEGVESDPVSDAWWVVGDREFLNEHDLSKLHDEHVLRSHIPYLASCEDCRRARGTNPARRLLPERRPRREVQADKFWYKGVCVLILVLVGCGALGAILWRPDRDSMCTDFVRWGRSLGIVGSQETVITMRSDGEPVDTSSPSMLCPLAPAIARNTRRLSADAVGEEIPS